jgi:hypothetical protein
MAERIIRTSSRTGDYIARPERRHCALTQQAARSHLVTGSGMLGRWPTDGLLGRLMDVVKDCGARTGARTGMLAVGAARSRHGMRTEDWN